MTPRELGRRVAELARRTPLVARATPQNWDREVERLILVRRAGRRDPPAFVYAPAVGARETAEELDGIARSAEASMAPPELASAARQLALEARIAAAVGTPELLPLARERFTSTAEEDARAERWASYPGRDGDEPMTVSDDERTPASLVSAMRRAIGERRLPVRVAVQRDLSALAATGDRVVLVAAGRLLRPRDVARTVLHEIEGHVLPALARASTGALHRLAGDADAEEGRALAIERAHGLLDERRRKELGLRHVAACSAHGGAALHDIIDRLELLGATTPQAVRVAARAMRGGGLGRERVYLPALWRSAPTGAGASTSTMRSPSEEPPLP